MTLTAFTLNMQLYRLQLFRCFDTAVVYAQVLFQFPFACCNDEPLCLQLAALQSVFDQSESGFDQAANSVA